jgi:flagellar protein FliO/FliZ
VIALWFLAQSGPIPSPVDGSLIRGVVGTVVVLGVLVLLAYLLRRGVLTLPGQRGPRALVAESALSLGDRRSVVILRVEGRRLLLGLAPGQVRVLTELGAAPPSFDQALDRASSGSTTGRSS